MNSCFASAIGDSQINSNDQSCTNGSTNMLRLTATFGDSFPDTSVNPYRFAHPQAIP
jgi:hypothetical protein